MRVLLAKGKHDTEIYDASTDEKLYNAALDILTERYDQGWYWAPKDEECVLPYTDDTLLQLKAIDKSVYQDACKKNERASYCVKENILLRSVFERIEKAVVDEDGESALHCLLDRKDFEYEFVEVRHTK